MFYGAAFTVERALWKAGQSGWAGSKATLATWRFRVSLNVWSPLLIRLMVERTALTQRVTRPPGEAAGRPGRGPGICTRSPGALLEDIFGWVLPQPLPAPGHRVFGYFW